MLRYLAAGWPPDDPESVAAVERLHLSLTNASEGRWMRSYRRGGLAVWEPPSQAGEPGETDDAFGRFIGRVFSRSGDRDRLRPSISRELASKIVASGGRLLGRGHWGNYVAFLHDPCSLSPVVIRDPMGALPCYFALGSGVKLFFSDLSDALPFLDRRPSINDRYLTAQIRVPKIQKALTGLNEIGEILPGEMVKLDTPERGKFVWNPAEVTHDRIDDINTASHEILAESRHVIEGLSKEFNRILCQVGGLDSSIIWSLFQEICPDKTRGVTLKTQSKMGDESFYTRQLSEFREREIVEIDLEPHKIDFDQLCAPLPSVSPPGFLDIVDLSYNVRDHGVFSGIDAYFYGVGGDSIFLQGADLYPVLDAVSGKRYLTALRVLFDACRYSRRSVYSALSAYLREIIYAGSAFEDVLKHITNGTELPGVSADIYRAPSPIDVVHPLLRESDGLPKGKYFQILSSCFMPTEYYDPYWTSEPRERVHVFLSQPLVELCLRLPAHLLAYRGIDRGFERYAFRDILPEGLVRRMSKGTPEEVYAQFTFRNRQRIREFILEGEMVRRGVLDRVAIEHMFDESRTDAIIYAHPLTQFVATEAWARQWSS